MKAPNSIHIPESITSTANAEVKFLRALHERKYRRQSGWFLAEGTRICSEAVSLGWEMHRLAFLAGRENEPHVRMLLDALDNSDGRALPMSEKLLQRISRKDNPQMLLGAFRQKWADLDTIFPDQTLATDHRPVKKGSLTEIAKLIKSTTIDYRPTRPNHADHR